MVKKKKESLFEEVTAGESARRFRESCEHRKRTGGRVELPSSNPWDWGELSESQYMDLQILGSDMPTPSYISQYEAVRRVNQLKERIESNGEESGFDVLYCVSQCATNDLVMPVWLAYAFNRRYHAVVQFRAISWDDPKSFGKPYPKNTNLTAQRKRRKSIPAVWMAVKDEVLAGKAVDKQLFSSVGHGLNLGATLTEKYYYDAIKKYGYPDAVEARDNQLAMLVGLAMVQKDQGKSQVQLGAVGALQIQGSPAMESRRFVKNSGNTKPRKTGAMKSLPTSEHEHALKPKQAASQPKRAPAKTATGRSPGRTT
jgi:hypothetical protein